MAAEVSSAVSSGSSEMLITRDLLGEFSKAGAKDLDLGLQVNLDLKSGMVFQQRLNSPISQPPSSVEKKQQPLNSNLEVLEESYLELKLLPSTAAGATQCQSVCTLDKVKYALQRAEQESISSSIYTTKKRSSSEERKLDGDGGFDASSNGMFAAACPGCLLYVMTLKANPKCPRCNSTVPSPIAVKKPRIDLNNSL